MDFAPLIEQKRKQFRELEEQVSSTTLFENPKRAKEIMREHARIRGLLEDWGSLEKTRKELEENRKLLTEPDSELAELAQTEIPVLENRIAELSNKVQYSLLPPEAHEERDAIVEIRAGTGGNEAALFAADLYRMYSRFAEAHAFKVEQLESSTSELGGFKEI